MAVTFTKHIARAQIKIKRQHIFINVDNFYVRAIHRSLETRYDLLVLKNQ